jgi:hypothetical protein
MMIMHIALAHVVAAEHEFVRASVPEREGKIAEQMLRAILAPLFVGAQQQRAVGHIAQFSWRDAERRCQFFAIVEP